MCGGVRRDTAQGICGSICRRECITTVAAIRFPALFGPPIVPLPRNRLAVSATGGASPVSPFSFRLAEKKTAVRGQKKRALLCRKAPPLRASVCLLRELLVRNSDRVRQSPAECAPLRRLNHCTPAGSAAAVFGVVDGFDVLLSPRVPLSLRAAGTIKISSPFSSKAAAARQEKQIVLKHPSVRLHYLMRGRAHSRTIFRRSRQKTCPHQYRYRFKVAGASPAGGLRRRGEAVFFWRGATVFFCQAQKKIGAHIFRAMVMAQSRPIGDWRNQTSSLTRGILIHLGPPRPRLSSAQGMVWMRMPSSSRERLVTWLRE